MAESMPFETAKQRKKRKGTGASRSFDDEEDFKAMTETKKKYIIKEELPEIPLLDEEEFPKMKKVKKKYSEKDVTET